MKTLSNDPIAAIQGPHGYLMDREQINAEPLERQLPGLTKREHFAGLAMASFFGGEFIGQSGIDDITIAKRCVSMADALIEELNNTAKS